MISAVWTADPYAAASALLSSNFDARGERLFEGARSQTVSRRRCHVRSRGGGRLGRAAWNESGEVELGRKNFDAAAPR
jgi:hypothetical protein